MIVIFSRGSPCAQPAALGKTQLAASKQEFLQLGQLSWIVTRKTDHTPCLRHSGDWMLTPPARPISVDNMFACCVAGLTEQQLFMLAHHMSQILLQHRQCLQALDDQSPDRAQSLALSALQLADRLPAPAKALGRHHVWRMRIHETLMRSCVDMGNDWPAALSLAKKLIPVYELVYPKVSQALCIAAQTQSRTL